MHVLAGSDRQPTGDDAWLALEWANVDREMNRTDRVLARAEVQQAAAALKAALPRDKAGEVDDEAHLPAVVEIARRLPEALAARGVPLEARFAASAAHFEGWGAREALEQVASRELIAELEAAGEMPDE